MSAGSPVPHDWLDGCREAHRRLEGLLANLTDEDARRPTALEGWTVGHLLTHLARNADSHAGIFEAAQRGQVIAQYPGGAQQREWGIEAGNARSAADLVEDVRATNRRLGHAWDATGEETWRTGMGLRSHGPASLPRLVALRWREVEVHMPDLRLPDGPTWADVSQEYIDLEWPGLMAGLPDRIPAGITLLVTPDDRPSEVAGSGERRVEVRGPSYRVLQWLFGRGGEEGWPELTQWH